MVTREENFVEVEVHEEILVEEHDSREKDGKKWGENTTTMREVLTSINSIRKYFPSQYPSSSTDCQGRKAWRTWQIFKCHSLLDH